VALIPHAEKGKTNVPSRHSWNKNELIDLDFPYPSRPGVKVLDQLSLKIPSISTTTLVGGQWEVAVCLFARSSGIDSTC
jgi:hypothetical protein